MPADRGNSSGDWHPKPDFSGGYRPGHTAEAIDYNDPEAIAQCLLDDDPAFMAYEHFPDVDLADVALEAAKAIINKRQTVYETRIQAVREAATQERVAFETIAANRREQLKKIRGETVYLALGTKVQDGKETVSTADPSQPLRLVR